MEYSGEFAALEDLLTVPSSKDPEALISKGKPDNKTGGLYGKKRGNYNGGINVFNCNSFIFRV